MISTRKGLVRFARRFFITFTLLTVTVGAAATASAQTIPSTGTGGVPRVVLTAGRSTVLPVDFDITRIAVTNPAIADAVVVAPREILIDGKAPGTISLIVWGDGRRTQYDIAVDAAVSQLQQQLRNLFPGEDIQVTVNEEATTLSGKVSSNAVMLKAGEIATATSSKQQRDQPAAGAGRHRQPAGDAPGAFRGSEPPGAE